MFLKQNSCLTSQPEDVPVHWVSVSTVCVLSSRQKPERILCSALIEGAVAALCTEKARPHHFSETAGQKIEWQETVI